MLVVSDHERHLSQNMAANGRNLNCLQKKMACETFKIGLGQNFEWQLFTLGCTKIFGAACQCMLNCAEAFGATCQFMSKCAKNVLDNCQIMLKFTIKAGVFSSQDPIYWDFYLDFQIWKLMPHLLREDW